MFDVSDSEYDSFMGRYSSRLGPVFADFAGIEAGQHVVDVGAGTGALTNELLRRGARVAAAEPSPSFAASLERRLPDVDVRVAAAEELPWADESFDAALAQLVLAFMADAPTGIAEMQRVVKPGGIVAACMWDRDQMEMLAAIDRTGRALGVQAQGPPLRYVSRDDITTLFGDDVDVEMLTVEAGYTGFDEFWEAMARAPGPARAWLSSLDPDGLARVRDEFRRQLGEPEGPFSLTGRAWAVRIRRE
jgi:SAM-dependent methyltransferase